MSAVSRVVPARAVGVPTVRTALIVAFGAGGGGLGGLILGLFLAIPLAGVVAGGRDLGIAAAVLCAVGGAAAAYRLDPGRARAATVVSAITFRKSRPDAPPRRQEPPSFAAPEPRNDGEQHMAEPRRESTPYVPAPQTELNALLGRGSDFDGKLSFEGTVRIDGTFTGEISTTDTLIVGESAKIQAEIACGTLVVHGEIVGNVRAREGVELHRPARVKGDIHTASLMIEKGVVFEGNSKMEAAEGNVVSIQRVSGETTS